MNLTFHLTLLYKTIEETILVGGNHANQLDYITDVTIYYHKHLDQ